MDISNSITAVLVTVVDMIVDVLGSSCTPNVGTPILPVPCADLCMTTRICNGSVNVGSGTGLSTRFVVGQGSSAAKAESQMTMTLIVIKFVIHYWIQFCYARSLQYNRNTKT